MARRLQTFTAEPDSVSELAVRRVARALELATAAGTALLRADVPEQQPRGLAVDRMSVYGGSLER